MQSIHQLPPLPTRNRQWAASSLHKMILGIFLMTVLLQFQSGRKSLALQNPKAPQLPALPDSEVSSTSAQITNTQESVSMRDIQNHPEPFRFVSKMLHSIGPRPIDSDVVELQHCQLELLDYDSYVAWAKAILDPAWPNLERKLFSKSSDFQNQSATIWKEQMLQELALGLLEIYATNEGYCDFSKYPLQLGHYDLNVAASTLRSVARVDPGELPRLAIVIIAFKDAPHLSSLVQALHLPHHFIIIHLERSTPREYSNQVRNIAKNYPNVVVIEFGTVIYRTDSVSMINFKIMNWLVNELNLTYDYHLTMDGAVFPLYNATGLCQHLKQASRDVWLGELLHNGKKVNGNPQWAFLLKKRFIYTLQGQRYHQRFKNINHHGFVATIPTFVRESVTNKTNSGNQAVYSYKFVKQLTKSPQVKQLFAIAKYSCCCCAEERTWVAAARIIGLGDVSLEARSMFQVWGGSNECKSSMNNAVLSNDEKTCYKIEDATLSYPGHKEGDAIHIYGNDMVEALKRAKKSGVMFARKFSSENSSSVKLKQLIEEEIHGN